jgi:hypothetical protein
MLMDQLPLFVGLAVVGLALLIGFAWLGHLVRQAEAPKIESDKIKSGKLESGNIIIKTYKGKQSQTAERFRADAIEMAARGFFPKVQSWAPGQWRGGDFLAAFLLCFFLIGFIALVYMLIVRPDGTLTVTYERQTNPAEEKICPMCAERIKAAALVCRFCGHKFPPNEVHESPP